jgi:uncharacterized membrane protein YdjX (TVP38/TMEM64 family)
MSSLAAVEQLQVQFETHGTRAKIVYAFFFALAYALFVPQLILAAGAGLLFGIFPGLLVSFAGILITGLVYYFAGSLWGTTIFSWFGANEQELFRRYVRPLDARTILHCRIAWIPFNPVSVACGMEAVPVSIFLAASALGLLPGLSAQVFLGSALDPDAGWILTACFFWAGYLVFQAGYTYWFFHRSIDRHLPTSESP